MVPTVGQPILIISVTVDFEVFCAKKPVVCSKASVNQESCAAHGTNSDVIPQRRQSTRRIRYSRWVIIPPRSK
jgi:hypothetical protein